LNDFGTRSELRAIQSFSIGWRITFVDNRLVREKTAPAHHAVEHLSAEISRQPDATKDPQNRLLARMNPHRLEFEELRDSLLMAAR
jgi:hypothetical protein